MLQNSNKHINSSKLEEIIGYEFINKSLLNQALTHKSTNKDLNNERLEFLGDAVVNLIVGKFLYQKFPKLNEGKLSKTRASLVSENALVIYSNQIKLEDYVMISIAEEKNNGREKKSIISDCFEALIGALYLENQINFIDEFMQKIINVSFKGMDLTKISNDFKTKLQELTQAKYTCIPEYRLVNSVGPDHKKEFFIDVFVENEKIGSGHANNKKQAEQESAKDALINMENKNDK